MERLNEETNEIEHVGVDADEVNAGTYAVLDERGVIENTAHSGADFAEEQGWVGPLDDLDPQPTRGWSTPDRGVTWLPPAG